MTDFTAYRRESTHRVGGEYWALAFPGAGRDTVWAHLYRLPQDCGWSAWGVGDEDLGAVIRSFLVSLPRNATVREALARCREAYAYFYEPQHGGQDDEAYDRWVMSMGDPSPSAQHFDANH